jgi:hypothetical protein
MTINELIELLEAIRDERAANGKFPNIDVGIVVDAGLNFGPESVFVYESPGLDDIVIIL